jgi:hypothetical protein
MYQPYPSSGQSAEPERPPAPGPVRTAVKFMYAGAAVWTVVLISALVLIIADSKAGHATLNGHPLHGRSVPVTVAAVFGLVVIALWLWMARATGQGRNWARILSTVLFGLATLQLRGVFEAPVSHLGAGLIVLGVIVPVLGWLAGLAAVWLLWRPASSAFFKPQAPAQAGPGAQPSSRTEASSRLPRQV